MPETIYQDPHEPFELEHRYGDGVHVLAEPFLLTHLANLGSPETTQPQINDLIEICYRRLLAAVVDRELPRASADVATRMHEFTPAGRYRGSVIDRQTRAFSVDIARAGTLPSHICFHMLNQLLDPSGVHQHHLTMQREVGSDGVVTGARIQGAKVGGNIEDAFLLIPDPMGATGSSIRRALEFYRTEVPGTPRRIVTVHLMVTPEYIRALRDFDPDVRIYAVRLDRGLSDDEVLQSVPGTFWDRERGLNERQYIVPGGGGFGEILNNTES